MRMSRQDQDGESDEEHIHKCGSARLEDELAADTLRELVRHASVLALLTRRGCGQGLELVAAERRIEHVSDSAQVHVCIERYEGLT